MPPLPMLLLKWFLDAVASPHSAQAAANRPFKLLRASASSPRPRRPPDGVSSPVGPVSRRTMKMVNLGPLAQSPAHTFRHERRRLTVRRPAGPRAPDSGPPARAGRGRPRKLLSPGSLTGPRGRSLTGRSLTGRSLTGRSLTGRSLTGLSSSSSRPHGPASRSEGPCEAARPASRVRVSPSSQRGEATQAPCRCPRRISALPRDWVCRRSSGGGGRTDAGLLPFACALLQGAGAAGGEPTDGPARAATDREMTTASTML